MGPTKLANCTNQLPSYLQSSRIPRPLFGPHLRVSPKGNTLRATPAAQPPAHCHSLIHAGFKPLLQPVIQTRCIRSLLLLSCCNSSPGELGRCQVELWETHGLLGESSTHCCFLTPLCVSRVYSLTVGILFCWEKIIPGILYKRDVLCKLDYCAYFMQSNTSCVFWFSNNNLQKYIKQKITNRR